MDCAKKPIITRSNKRAKPGTLKGRYASNKKVGPLMLNSAFTILSLKPDTLNPEKLTGRQRPKHFWCRCSPGSDKSHLTYLSRRRKVQGTTPAWAVKAPKAFLIFRGLDDIDGLGHIRFIGFGLSLQGWRAHRFGFWGLQVFGF